MTRLLVLSRDAEASEAEALLALRSALADHLRQVVAQYDPEDLPTQSPDVSGTPGAGAPIGRITAAPPAAIGIQQRQLTAHCTNRRVIGLPFRLPDWLKLLDLPAPGSAEYAAAVAERLMRLKARGIDTVPLERMIAALRRRAEGLEAHAELPGFLASVLPGWFGEPPADPAALAAWRAAMVSRVDAYWLRLLASEDPSLIAQGLRARAGAFGQFDAALRDAAEAAVEAIDNHQREAEFGLNMLLALPQPHVQLAGVLLDLLILARRETLSGDTLTPTDIAVIVGLRGLISAAPKLGAAAWQRILQTENGRLLVTATGELAQYLGDAGRRTLAKVWDTSVEEVGKRLSGYLEYWTRQRNLRGGIDWRLGRRATMAVRQFTPLRAGQAALARQKIDRRAAERLLDRLAATTNAREFRRLVLQVQANDMAKAMINTPRYSNALRARAIAVNRVIGDLTDNTTALEIMRMDPSLSGLKRVLDRHKLGAEDVIVRSRTITGRRSDGGRVHFGQDRDVWFEFVDRRSGERLADVGREIARPIYERNLQRITGRSRGELAHHVTDRLDPEAYGTGLVRPVEHEREAMRIARGAAAGDLRRAQDVADSVLHKVMAPMESLRQGAGPLERQRALRESMRTWIKEYERHIGPFLRRRMGVHPSLDRAGFEEFLLPPRIRIAQRLYRRVENGLLDDSFTPEAAEAALRAIGTTPEGVARGLAGLVEGVNLW